jgi:hypothetical protein
MKDKDQKKLDNYLRNMMGSFTEEDLKEGAKLGLKNLRLEIDSKVSDY